MPIDKYKLAQVQAIASIASSLAIPVVIAVIGYFVQKQLADEGLKKDYVSIAVGILNSDPSSQEQDLRKWAVTVLDANSPIPFSAKARDSLERGISIPVMPAIPAPPEECMVPPKERTTFEAYAALSEKARKADSISELLDLMLDFSNSVIKEEEAAVRATILLRCMQSYAKMLNEGDEALRRQLGLEPSKSVYERLERERLLDSSVESTGTGVPQSK